MAALFLTVLELSIRGSLLILAILPIRALLKKAPRWSICLLWALAAIALVCPIRFESTASVLPSDRVISEIIAPAPTMPLVQTEPILIQDLPVENGVHIVTHTEPDYGFVAALVWLMGVAVMVSVAAVSYMRLKKQVAASLPVKDKVYLCDDIDSPFILGIIRPRIYLPSALDTALYPSVLLHEYAHLKRRDHWWKPLGYLLLTVHWFNPLVWLGYGLLCRDIELACDEKVIRDMDSRDKKHYSEALLQCSMPRRLITACPLAFGEVGAKQRIKAVLSYKKPAFWVIVIALVLCAALALGFLTDPKVTTLGEMGIIGSVELHSISINSGDKYQDFTPDHLTELLSQLELQQCIGNPSMEFQTYMTLIPDGEGIEYFLWFNKDCTRLHLGHNELTADGKETYHAGVETYKVLNPEVLTEANRSELTTEALDMRNGVKFRLDPAQVEQVLTTTLNDRSLCFTDPHSILELCGLLNTLEFSEESSYSNFSEALSLQLYFNNQDRIDVRFGGNLSSCTISVHRMVDGAEMNTLYTNVYQVRNPDLLTESPLVQTATDLQPIYPPIPRGDFMDALDKSLSPKGIAAFTEALPPSLTEEISFQCTATLPYAATYEGVFHTNIALSFELYYANNSCNMVNFRTEPHVYNLYLTDAPIPVTVTPNNGGDPVNLEVAVEPTTGRILSISVAEQATPNAEAMLTAIEEHLSNKNKNIANLTLIGNVFSHGNTYYTVVSMDYTARDGSVISKNNLYLAQLRWMDASPNGYFLVEGLAEGEWGSSAGYYPNAADFGGQTVIWTTRNDTHLKVFDGGVGSDGTVPNTYDTYRITCASGAAYDWNVQNAAGVYLLPKGETAVRVAPLHNNNGYEVSAFAFDMSKIETVEVRTISEQSGLNVFLEMDTDSGEILELHSQPIGDPIFPNGFNEHKALYQALLSHPDFTHWDLDSLVLLGQQSYGDYEYAVISYDDHEAVLVEYTIEDDTATLLNYAVGYAPDTSGMRTGYHMNTSNMEGGILYWSVYGPRYKVTPNGKDVDESRETVTPDFSGFRFTMRDLKTHDFPADDSFFLCEFTGVIPPAIVTPMEKGRLLAALGSEVSGGLTGTISLQ